MQVVRGERLRRRIAMVGDALVPDTLRLIRIDARPPHGSHQESAGGQGIVAHHFGRHPIARTPREQRIRGIELKECLRGVRGLPIGARHHNQSVELLDVPA